VVLLGIRVRVQPSVMVRVPAAIARVLDFRSEGLRIFGYSLQVL